MFRKSPVAPKSLMKHIAFSNRYGDQDIESVTKILFPAKLSFYRNVLFERKMLTERKFGRKRYRDRTRSADREQW